jgi:hypothetical protein
MHKLPVRSFLIAVLSLALLAGVDAPAITQDASPTAGGVTILEPDESYAGATRGEWAARSWQWVVSLPAEVNPGFNPSGPGCGYGQSGPVFFLTGSFTPDPIDMTCVVAEGVAIFVPLGDAACTTVEAPPFFGRDEADLAACAAANNQVPIADVTVTINGQGIPNLEAYHTVTPAFPLTFPNNNPFGLPAGVALMVDDGYSILIAPPAPGTYDLVISGPGLVWMYRLIVQAPQVIEPAGSPEAATPVA